MTFSRGGTRLRAAIAVVAAGLTMFALPADGMAGKKKKKEGRMTGGGSVFRSDGQRVTHGFQLRCRYTDPRQNLEINWGGNRFHLEELTFASCVDDPNIDPRPPSAPFDTYRGEGEGRYNGESGATARWEFTDAGEPGTRDRATIVIHDADGNLVLEVSNVLNRGNHQAHRTTGSG